MALLLTLPGSDHRWVLPPGWTEAEFRRAWNTARSERKDMVITIADRPGEGPRASITVYPSLVSWYGLSER